MGILLIFFAAGLLGNAIQNLQALGSLTIGTTPLWNMSHILSQESVIGDLLHGIIGYSDAPSRLQALFYVVYLVVVGGIFAWMTRKPSSGQPVRSDSPSANTVAGQA